MTKGRSEVGIVVCWVKFDRCLELKLSASDLTAVVKGSREGLSYRTFGRLFLGGALKDDRGLMIVAFTHELESPREQLVGVLVFHRLDSFAPPVSESWEPPAAR